LLKKSTVRTNWNGFHPGDDDDDDDEQSTRYRRG